MTPAESAVLAVGLAPTKGASSSPAVSVDAAEFEVLLQWVMGERLFGLLAVALDRRVLVVGPTEGDHLEAVERSVRAHRVALRSTLAAEATAANTVRLLRRRGVEAYVFKGSATAHLDYDDPANRTFYDADLHVARRDFERSIDALDRAGFQAAPTPMSRRWQCRFARACEMRSSDGVELDLHAAVATGYFGVRLDHDRLRSDRERVVLGGETVSVFSAPARALISCYGVVLSRGPGLRLQRDLAQQLVRLDDRWPELVALSGDDGPAVVAAAVDAIVSTFGPELFDAALPVWADALAPEGQAKRALELAEQGLTRGWSADARSTLLALTPLDRARFGIGVAASRLRRLA